MLGSWRRRRAGRAGVGRLARALVGLALGAMASLAPLGAALAQTAQPEIVELARALKNDPDLIYEYVYNNIETIPLYGSLKGPLGALVDGKGTAVDQAELMVQLLQQAAINNPAITNIQYQTGTVWLTQNQLANWLGIDSAPSTASVALGTAGIPTAILQNAGATVCVVVTETWVQVTINGQTVVFDPANKFSNQQASDLTNQGSTCLAHSAQPAATGYTRVAGINLATATGYSASTFLSRAESGATITDRSVAGLNRANVRADLTTFSNSLVSWIRTNRPAAGPNDILGGKTITPLPIGLHQRWASLPYQCLPAQSGSCVAPTTDPAIASTLRTTLSINVPGSAGAVVFNSADIYGHRLSVFFNASNQPVLALDGITEATGSAVGTGANVALQVSVRHPASFQNQLNMTLNVAQGGSYVISNGWGGVSRGMIERHRRLLLVNQQANPGQPAMEPVLGETISVIANTWMAEVTTANDLVSRTGGVMFVPAHNVGVAGYKAIGGGGAGPFVDLPLNAVGTIQLTGRPAGSTSPAESGAFYASAKLSSVFESGIIEQTQPGNTAVSTVKLLDQASQTDTIFDINNSAVTGDNSSYWTSTIKPQFQNFYTGAIGTSDLNRINSLVTSSNLRVIAALHGPQTINQWTGSGYFQITQTGNSIGAIISGGQSGGFSTVDEPIPLLTVNTPALQVVPGTSPGSIGPVSFVTGVPTATFSPSSRDPVSLATGSFASDHDDLSVGTGAAPYSLTFSRHYESASRFAPSGPLGMGWTHNFLSSAHADTDGFAGMAAESPISGAAAIAAVYILQDLMNGGSNAKPLDKLIVAVQTERWLMDQLTNNTVDVTQGPSSLQFVKLSDGSYNPPLKSNATLTLAGGLYKLTLPDKTAFNFNSNGDLATIQRVSGTTITLNYNPSHQLTSVTNGMGRSLTFTYTGAQITAITDGVHTVHYGYASNNLTAYQDPSGNSITYTYDLPGRLTKIFFPSFPTSAFVSNTYSVFDKVNSQLDGNGNATTLLLAGSRAEQIDAVGNSDVQYMSQRGDTTIHIDALGNQTISTYDGLDRLVSITLPEFNKITYAYDDVHGPAAQQNVLAITDTPKPGSPLAAIVRSSTYEPSFNGVATSTDANGNITSYVYDIAGGTGNLLEIDQPAVGGQVPKTTFTYNARGQVLTKTDPTGKVTLNVYDTTTEVLLSTTDDNVTLKLKTQYGYDPVGNITTITDPNNNVSTITYDLLRRVTQVSGPPSTGAVTKTTYNADGLVTQVQRATGNAASPWETRTATYSVSGQKLTETDPNNHTTTYTYDALDRLLSVTDAASRVTTNTYDGVGRVIAVTNTGVQAAPLVQYAFTANGKRRTLIDANNNVSTYVYDGLDRLASLQYPLATRGAGASNAGNAESYSYDQNGNPLTHTKRDGSVITATYDALNRPLTKQYPGHVNDIYLTYDLAGRITSQRYGSLTGAGVIYGYDSAGRMTSEATNGQAMAYSYDPAGNRTRVTWPDAFYVAYSYDALNRLTSIAENGATSGAGVLATYSYDPLSRRTSGALGNGAAIAYGYDAADRLTTLTHTMPSGASAQNLGVTFGYTASNQLQTRASNNPTYEWNGYGTGTNNNTADGLNRDSAIAALSDGYDGNGNVTDDGTRILAYDFDNRLKTIAIASSSTNVTLSYDPASRLRQQQTTVGASATVVTQYLYVGRQLVAEYDGSGTLLRRYVHGPGTDEPIVWYEGSGTGDRRWLHADERGSIVAYSKVSGAAVTTSFGPYGEPSSWGGSRFAYTGQIQFAEVQLYHYKGRVYDPAAGRFLQTDPAGYDGGFNLYAYVGGDPLNLRDPLGLSASPGYTIVAAPHAGTYPTQDAAALAAKGDIQAVNSPNEYGTFITRNITVTQTNLGPDPFNPQGGDIVATNFGNSYTYNDLRTSGHTGDVTLGNVPSNASAWIHDHPASGNFNQDNANIHPSPSVNSGGCGDWCIVQKILPHIPDFTTYIVGPDGVLRAYTTSPNAGRIVR